MTAGFSRNFHFSNNCYHHNRPKTPLPETQHTFFSVVDKSTSLKPGANTLYQLFPVPTCGTHRINQLVTSYARSPPVTPTGSTSWIFSRGEENHPQTRAGGWGQTNTTRMQPHQVELEECNRTPSKTSAPWSPLESTRTCTFFLKQAIVNRGSIRNFNNTTPKLHYVYAFHQIPLSCTFACTPHTFPTGISYLSSYVSTSEKFLTTMAHLLN